MILKRIKSKIMNGLVLICVWQDEKIHNQHSVGNQNSTLGFRRALNENLQRCTKIPRHMYVPCVIIDWKTGKYFLEMF